MSIIGSNILAGASGQGGAYEIARSLRFNGTGDSAYLSRTPSSAGNRTTWTWSGWVKRSNLGANQGLFSAGTDTSNFEYIRFDSDDTIRYTFYISGSVQSYQQTDAKFRDVSAWYHVLVYRSGTTAKIYINGVEQSLSNNTTSSSNGFFNATNDHNLGRREDSASQYFDGYMTEVNFVDGQALDASYFGETDSDTGAWIPKKYSGTYGTNGFYLNFSDNSGVTATTLGKDSSGNGNNWTPNNFSVTAGAGNDSLEDTPTNNWCTLNPLKKESITVSEGNLKAVGGADYVAIHGTIGLPSSGKFYWEATVNSTSGSVTDQYVGVAGNDTALTGTSPYPQSDTPALYYVGGGTLTKNGTTNVQTGLGAFSADDVIGVAYDADASTVQFYKNGSAVGTAESLPSTTETLFPAYVTTTNRFANFNWGQRSFDQTPPTGFKALNTANLPVPTVKNGTEYFNTVLWTGNDTTRDITVGFQPDFTWIKARSATSNHPVFDSVRGVLKEIYTNLSNQESSETNGLSQFNSDGFRLLNTRWNGTGITFVAWNWLAGGSGSANTDGTISSTVNVNADAGFSVGTFSGTGSTGSIGHGLGVAPKFILIKNRDSATSWAVYHDAAGANKQLLLNSQNGTSNDTNGFPSAPTSTVINVGTGSAMDTNQSGSHVFYAFAEVEGYSKFGSYTGNGSSSNGTFVFLPFKPAFVMTKRIDSTGSWYMFDNTRATYNETEPYVLANAANVEATDLGWDLLSNGFKHRTGYIEQNTSGGSYIYMAFAETPFKYANAV